MRPACPCALPPSSAARNSCWWRWSRERTGSGRVPDRQGLRRGHQLLPGRRFSGDRRACSRRSMPAAVRASRCIGARARCPISSSWAAIASRSTSVLGALAERGYRAHDRGRQPRRRGGGRARRMRPCARCISSIRQAASTTPICCGPGLALVKGWQRMQGFVHRRGRRPLRGTQCRGSARGRARRRRNCLMVNRNAGAGTRVLIDRLLDGARPPGYSNQPRSHNAVAAAVAQGRADWGIAIAPVAQLYGLGFLPIAPEDYDFLLVESRRERPAVQAFLGGAARSRADRARHNPRASGMQPCRTPVNERKSAGDKRRYEPRCYPDSQPWKAVGRAPQCITRLHDRRRRRVLAAAQAQLRGHGGPVRAVAISPDGTRRSPAASTPRPSAGRCNAMPPSRCCASMTARSMRWPSSRTAGSPPAARTRASRSGRRAGRRRRWCSKATRRRWWRSRSRRMARCWRRPPGTVRRGCGRSPAALRA